MDNNYLIWATVDNTCVASIRTETIYSDECNMIVQNLKLLFPSNYKWDYSNQDWTTKEQFTK